MFLKVIDLSLGWRLAFLIGPVLGLVILGPAAVTLIRKGSQPYAVSLPDSCPTLPITTRMGREIMMRQDTMRYADGSVRGIIPQDEAIDALAAGLPPPDPVSGRPRRTTHPGQEEPR